MLSPKSKKISKEKISQSMRTIEVNDEEYESIIEKRETLTCEYCGKYNTTLKFKPGEHLLDCDKFKEEHNILFAIADKFIEMLGLDEQHTNFSLTNDKKVLVLNTRPDIYIGYDKIQICGWGLDSVELPISDPEFFDEPKNILKYFIDQFENKLLDSLKYDYGDPIKERSIGSFKIGFNTEVMIKNSEGEIIDRKMVHSF